tara:strand:- start:34032 stop:34820 length:789 start_codon:yes stop_codon:yes gene_type:complete
VRALLFFLLFFSYAKAAEEFLEFGDNNFAKEKTEKSKWTIRSGFQFIDYPLALPEFNGQHNNTSEGDTAGTYGITIGVGREFYLGAGVSSTLLFTGSYSKSIVKDIGQAAQDIDVEVSNMRLDSQVAMYEGSISLNYLFDNKVVDLQPFIDFGAGAGTANIEKEYTRKELPGETNGSELYFARSEEEFIYTRLGLGLNIIAFDGFVSFLKLDAYQMAKQSISISGESNAFGSSTVVSLDSEDKEFNQSEQVYSASLGMGYLF